jgi:hypothetical protein
MDAASRIALPLEGFAAPTDDLVLAQRQQRALLLRRQLGQGAVTVDRIGYAVFLSEIALGRLGTRQRPGP